MGENINSSTPVPDSSDIIFTIASNKTEDFNQKYFRPSCLPALNIRNLNDLIMKIHNEDPAKVTVPGELMATPLDTIVNYYSILREATLPEEGIGCGTVGMVMLPYPIAYNFLSTGYRKRLPYEQYLISFQGISHINLIKIIRNSKAENNESKSQYYIELEAVSSSSCFKYSFGTIAIVMENNLYKIDNIDMASEEYFCAPYHGWQHNAELMVDIIYGNWCHLIDIRYPTVETNYKKNIFIKGTDGNNYLLTFIKLTNGTDAEIGQYKQSDLGEWLPVNIDPFSCIQS